MQITGYIDAAHRKGEDFAATTARTPAAAVVTARSRLRAIAAGLIALALAAGCTTGPDTPPPNRELELSYLRPVVAADLLDYALIEVPALDNVKLVPDGGDGYLGLRTYGGQPLKNNGVRAEISIDYPYHEGDTLTYSWKLMLPDNFPSDAPQNRWWVFADWHDQPNRDRGETWDNFPRRSAPIILGYGQIDGRDLLSLSYGSPDPKPVGLIPFTRGRWHDISVQITFSRGPGGRAAVYLDHAATPVQQASGPNMHNDFQHYLKVGTYRDPDIRGDAWVYLDAITITREPVASPT